MKKLSLFNKIVLAVNFIFIAGLLFSFFLPHLSPQKFGLTSLVSLTVPVLIIGNILFLIYWILTKYKKLLIPSAIVLILSFFFIAPLYKFTSKKNVIDNSFSIMSYNIRHFNKYNWIKTEDIDKKISKFILGEQPDIVVFQEYKKTDNFELAYPYYSNPLIGNYRDSIRNSKYRTSYSFYSKLPIINEGVIKYDGFKPSTIYADIVKNNDTIRVYNYHFTSLGVIPDEEYFGHKDSEKLIKGLRSSFKTQQIQINALNKHIKSCKYKVILAGDMNNTAYSWIYKNTKQNLKDTFLEAGSGFGRTYSFKGFPLRIDYIFAGKDMKVHQHQNYDVKYSDHYPIMATVSF